MDKRLRLYQTATEVRYSKKKKKAYIRTTIPKEFLGSNANIVIYSKRKRG